MATKLKNLKLTSVDLVRAGANQEADICLFKSADPPEATESPTEEEKNIFKRFLNWIRENPTEAENEPQSPIEKADEQPDLEFIYKSALAESLQSIMADDTLTEIEKKDMTEQSLRQYAEKIQEMERKEEIRDEIEDRIEDDDDTIEEEIIEEVEERKGDDGFYDYIEETQIRKYNHNHGPDGKFTSGPGGGGSRSSGSTGTSPASAAMRRFAENATGTVHTYNSDGKLVSSKPGGMSGGTKDVPGINHYSGVYDKPYHNKARHLASVIGSSKASGTITAKKVKEAKERGGTVKDFAGKSYMISPQTKGGISAYIGTKGKGGAFNVERRTSGINTLDDAQMWAVGTILNGD